MKKKYFEENLNTRLIDWANGESEKELAFKFSKPNNTKSENGEMECYFRDLEEHLIDKIKQYPIVVGCVAWLTNKKILEALITRDIASIIIQKEDFLRPDSGKWDKEELRELYKQMPPGVARCNEDNSFYWGEIINKLSTSYVWDTKAIRWMGNFNTYKKSAFPRMHNKFLVFCDIKEVITIERELNKTSEYKTKYITPKSAWTGSFNPTYNGTCSLENAVFIKNKKIVEAYYKEWQYIFALSEDIGEIYWSGEWDFPSFRIGS